MPALTCTGGWTDTLFQLHWKKLVEKPWTVDKSYLIAHLVEWIVSTELDCECCATCWESLQKWKPLKEQN